MKRAEKRVLTAVMSREQTLRELRDGLGLPDKAVSSAVASLIRECLIAYDPYSNQYRVLSTTERTAKLAAAG